MESNKSSHKSRASNAQYLINYFKKLGFSESKLMKGVSVNKSFLADPHNWLPINDFHQIVQNCQKAIPQLTIDDWQDIASFIKEGETTGIWKTIGKFIGVKSLYSLTPQYTKSFNTYIFLKINSISNTSVDMQIISDPNVCSVIMVRWTVGVLQAIPCILGLPTAKTRILFDQADIKSVVKDLYTFHDLDYMENQGVIYIKGKAYARRIQLHQTIHNGEVLFSYQYSDEQPYNSTLITEDLIVNNSRLLKKGDIFNAPYGRVIITWDQTKTKYPFMHSRRLKEELLIAFNTQLTLADNRYLEAERLRQDACKKNIALQQALKELEKTKNALQVYWEQKARDRAELEKKAVLKIKNIVNPGLRQLYESGLNTSQKKKLDQLNRKIDDALLPFATHMTLKDYNLTPAELRIINLIQKGLQSKEISESLNISLRTVETHRMNIRKKLDISNQGMNLSTYLLSIKQTDLV